VSGGGAAPAIGPQFIARGADIWTGWPVVNQVNILGDIGVSVLQSVFSLVASSRAQTITNDLTARGIPILFTDEGTFGLLCSEAIACFLSSSAAVPPSTPSPTPVILFNPAYLNEPPASLAAVLVHEGTHFQQYLDGRLFDPALGTVDTEFDAFWNAAAYWQDVRSSQSPFTSPLELEVEGIYRLALQGVPQLRDHIVALYCGGAPSC
jgi:hypothetical protein